ncbi:MAG: sulfatase activating formylglycine-generating enzyme [Myxococcota bacterium]
MILVLLMGCGTECPAGSTLAEDGLCYLDDDTAATGESCAAVDGSSGEVVGTVDCLSGRCTVPEGPFWMGEASPESPDRCPPRPVTLSSFTVDQHEVTVGEYAACTATGSCSAQPVCESGEGADIPVTCVTWQDAVDYCGWAGGRLPTEAEWEKAARDEQGARWAWGGQPPTCNHANFRFVTTYCHLSLIPVGSYTQTSAYGLSDTAGNAWEWTADHYDAGYYALAPDTDPPGPESCRLTVDGEPETCRYRVIRGGAFNTPESVIPGSARSLAAPDITDPNIGFRCAY